MLKSFEASKAFERPSLFMGLGLRQNLYKCVTDAKFLNAMMLSMKLYTEIDENIPEHTNGAISSYSLPCVPLIRAPANALKGLSVGHLM